MSMKLAGDDRQGPLAARGPSMTGRQTHAQVRFWPLLSAGGGPASIPARSAAAVALRPGQRFRLVNVHGGQCVDFWAFADDGSDVLSMEHCASVLSRTRFRPGDILVSARRRPMLTILADTGPGCHDAVLCACSAELYEELGCSQYHANCDDNLHAALAAACISWPRVCTPSPWNLWMHVDHCEGGEVMRHPPAAAPGDALLLRAERGLVVVASACPQDMGGPTNLGARVVPKSVEFEVFDPPPSDVQDVAAGTVPAETDTTGPMFAE